MVITFYAPCVKHGTKTTQTVKGMTNMIYSKQTTEFASNLVSHYATWHDTSDYYSLDISEISDFDLHEFARLLMLEDASWASEATGPDNPRYETRMLPALLRYLKNTTDRDEEIEFTKEWRDGITSYFHRAMQEIIDDLCNDKLHSTMNDAGFYPHRRPDNGELYWSRA